MGHLLRYVVAVPDAAVLENENNNSKDPPTAAPPPPPLDVIDADEVLAQMESSFNLALTKNQHDQYGSQFDSEVTIVGKSIKMYETERDFNSFI